MKNTWKTLGCIGLFLGVGSFAQAADETWTGKISDDMCGASHAKMAAEHADAKMTDRDCTLACVKGGGKYVFVSGEKVYKIENQDSPLLQQHAGHTVKLTGEMKGETVTVSNIVMPGKK
jgi:hypothetical protein